MDRRHFIQGAAGATALALAVGGCGSGGQSAPLRGEAWPEAEALFGSEPRWLGGDGVYSVDLGGGRILWLFGDSFIATSDALRRDEATMVRNSLAIQSGTDPTTATMRFYWREAGGVPSDFFSGAPEGRWLWPWHGARVGERLLLFQAIVRSTGSGLGFTGDGWQVQQVMNPDDDPDDWLMDTIVVPNRFDLTVGCALLADSSHLYAYATPNDRPRAVYLARWSLADAAEGRLTDPHWYVGDGHWQAQATGTRAPRAIMGEAQSEFNVYPLPVVAPQVMLQTDGFGRASLALRTAPEPQGPWSATRTVYQPPENALPEVMVYAAKLHTAVSCPGAVAVASYSVNCFDFDRLLADDRYYYPKVVKLIASSTD